MCCNGGRVGWGDGEEGRGRDVIIGWGDGAEGKGGEIFVSVCVSFLVPTRARVCARVSICVFVASGKGMDCASQGGVQMRMLVARSLSLARTSLSTHFAVHAGKAGGAAEKAASLLSSSLRGPVR